MVLFFCWYHSLSFKLASKLLVCCLLTCWSSDICLSMKLHSSSCTCFARLLTSFFWSWCFWTLKISFCNCYYHIVWSLQFWILILLSDLWIFHYWVSIIFLFTRWVSVKFPESNLEICTWWFCDLNFFDWIICPIICNFAVATSVAQIQSTLNLPFIPPSNPDPGFIYLFIYFTNIYTG